MKKFLMGNLSTLIPKSLGSLLLIMILCISYGCTHTKVITKEKQGDFFKEINSYDGERIMTIILNGGDEYNSKIVTVSKDSTYFLDEVANKIISVRTSDIKEISQKYTGRGLWEGLGTGLFCGFILGAVVGLSSGDDPPKKGFYIFNFTAEEKALIGGISLGVLSGIIGIPVGAMIGSTNKYIFKDNIELDQNRPRNQVEK